jgi:hypothetical protein
MRAGRRLIALTALAFGAFASLSAQDSLKILRIAGFGGDAIQPGEAVALQNLVTSYVIELKMFRVIDESGQELALKEAETAVQLGLSKDITPLAADFLLSGRANRIGSYIVFTMDVTRVSNGEKKSVADSFTTVNDLILAAHRLTNALFEKQAAAPSSARSSSSQALPSARANPAPSLSLLAGTWRGDKNVDRVSILPDGRGVAVLASGVRMAVKVSIEGAAVIVLQNQPNSADFYRPSLDLSSAKIVAQSARPWRWVFSLSSDGNNLDGFKESVFVSVDQKGAVAVDNAYVRDAAWKRLYR